MIKRVEGSAINAIAIFLMVIIVGAFWRFLSIRFANTAIGQAMAFVY